MPLHHLDAVLTCPFIRHTCWVCFCVFTDRLDSFPAMQQYPERLFCSSDNFLHASFKEPEAEASGFPKRGPRTTHRSMSGFQVNIAPRPPLSCGLFFNPSSPPPQQQQSQNLEDNTARAVTEKIHLCTLNSPEQKSFSFLRAISFRNSATAAPLSGEYRELLCKK